MVPRPDLIEMDMSVGDGMKLIISGGAVVPPWGGTMSQPTVSTPIPAGAVVAASADVLGTPADR
jgi:uncharacterized membrane protein